MERGKKEISQWFVFDCISYSLLTFFAVFMRLPFPFWIHGNWVNICVCGCQVECVFIFMLNAFSWDVSFHARKKSCAFFVFCEKSSNIRSGCCVVVVTIFSSFVYLVAHVRNRRAISKIKQLSMRIPIANICKGNINIWTHIHAYTVKLNSAVSHQSDLRKKRLCRGNQYPKAHRERERAGVCEQVS